MRTLYYCHINSHYKVFNTGNVQVNTVLQFAYQTLRQRCTNVCRATQSRTGLFLMWYIALMTDTVSDSRTASNPLPPPSPSKHKTFVSHLYNVGPTSETLGRRCTNVYKCFVFAGHFSLTIEGMSAIFSLIMELWSGIKFIIFWICYRLRPFVKIYKYSHIKFCIYNNDT